MKILKSAQSEHLHRGCAGHFVRAVPEISCRYFAFKLTEQPLPKSKDPTSGPTMFPENALLYTKVNKTSGEKKSIIILNPTYHGALLQNPFGSEWLNMGLHDDMRTEAEPLPV